MKEIVVLSGKGGVGKSVLTASLGRIFSAAHRVVLADTDVDAPNLHLTLGASLVSRQEIETAEKARIDHDACQACLACREVCRFSAIIGEESPLIVPYACEGCGACAIVCPARAITMAKTANGWINIFDAGMPVVAGELQIGESSSGLLVDKVKEKAREEARQGDAEILLIDGPPGIGCPVIAAVRGADFVAAVTEPTPAALHDLARMLQVVRHFQVEVGIVINRSDMHPTSKEAIYRHAGDFGHPILAEIPHDRQVGLALRRGRAVVDAYPDAPAAKAISALAAILGEKVMTVGQSRP
ncbi:ATP-binding protein [Thiovibrio sp. JS02]